MSKVTSKLQVTIPKAVADAYRIRPGDDVEWMAAGEVIHLVPQRAEAPLREVNERLKLFDRATKRQRERERSHPIGRQTRPRGRGWSRDELYDRGSPR